MRRVRSILGREGGQAMVLVVVAATVLSVLAITLSQLVTGESQRSARAVATDASYQAAEAGINDYLSKLVDDKLYFAHYVDPAEATRQDAGSGTTVGPTESCTSSSKGTPAAWGYPTNPPWTYPNGRDRWCPLGNGYEYDLTITPPSPSQTAVEILSTGRKVGATDLSNTRIIDVLVQPSSITDYYRIVNNSVNIGATTYGKVYAKGTINHTGTAYASLYSETSVTGSPDLQGGAQIYTPSTTPSIRSQPGLSSPLDFNDFLASLSDISRAAQNGGVYMSDSSKAAFKLVFANDGTFTVEACTKTGGKDVANAQPTCSSYTPSGCSSGVCNVPSNGAIYAEQTAIVSGSVKGRATVASNNNIVVAADINPVTSGTDVIGLIAKNYVYVADYAPSSLTWTAGVLAETGTWKTYSTSHSGNMYFYGSSATDDGGSFAFTERFYYYDSTLQYLPPPWFPSVGQSPYDIELFRELPPS
jgi:Tfp pilus assembly protein PilX